MPLIQSKSKKAFSKNVEAEMNSGKPQNQALAIAYNVKRKPKKKAAGGSVQSGSKDMNMAEGGAVKNERVPSEARPMPAERDKDSAMVSRNSGNKPAKNDNWLDNPSVKDAQRPKYQPLSRPRLANSAFKVRDRADIDKEERMMYELAPDGYGKQPDQEYDELGARRNGPQPPLLRMKRMAKGGMALDSDHSGNLHNKPVDHEYGDGSEEDEQMEPKGLQEDDDQMRPPKDEYMAGDMQGYQSGGSVSDDDDNIFVRAGKAIDDWAGNSSSSSSSSPPSDPDPDKANALAKGMGYADGGDVDHYSENEDQEPHQDELEEEMHDSIAAAIMAKRDRMKGAARSGSEDMDSAAMYANGGRVEYEDVDDDMVNIDQNGQEYPNGYYDRNEDKVLKENYDEAMHGVDQPMDSNEKGDSIDADEHDMVSQIRSKMKARKQFR